LFFGVDAMSIRKRFWRTAKGEEKQAWIVDYADQGGKRHIKTFERKKDAKDYADKASVDVKAGVHVADSETVTVSKAAALWLEDCAANGLERATLAQYRQHVNLHIAPYLGREKLSRLSTPMVCDFRDKLRRGDPAPGETEGRARSPALIRKIVTSLGSLIGHAKERGRFAGANPVRDIAKGKRGHGKRAEKRQKGRLQIGRDIPSRDEIKRLLEASARQQTPILKVAIFCGLRASELRGLRWIDVDLKRGEIHVKQRADRYLQIGPPKSDAGERKVPIPPNVLKALKEWKLACPNGELGLVFPSSTGKLQHHSNIVRDILTPAMKEAWLVTADGKPKYGLHSLRHFFASWLINRKEDGGREMPLKTAQMLLGHSSITMTADVYGHLFPRGDDAAELAEAERSILG
jgi:integrase